MNEADPIVIVPVQGAAEWFAARVGKITASRFKDVMAKLKSGAPAKARDDYLWELVVERLTGSAVDHFASTAMQWGNDQEEPAEMGYTARTGAIVEKVGFMLHPTRPSVGCSPDGLIGLKGGWEGKCPFNSAIHLQTFLNGMPDEHRPQVQGAMWCLEREWWDFTSFDPRLPAPFDLYVERIPRDQEFIDRLALEVDAFEKDVATMLAKLALKGSNARS